MANQEQLDILKQGPDVWNNWRQEHPDIQPDLSRTSLLEASLYEFNLSEANLYGAKLIGVVLTGANLSRADLRVADLRGANLIRANLREANFTEANLSHAMLHSADLREANFTEADLRGVLSHKANWSGADLFRAKLSGAILSASNFSRTFFSYGALLMGVDFSESNLSGAVLTGAYLSGATLRGADLSKADLRKASLNSANLSETNLSGADLQEADLSGVNLSEANLTGANLMNCRIYAVSAWDVELKDTIQSNLIITPVEQSTITVDNLKIAQFMYLLLNNAEIREVIDTLTTKVVLILGRFTPQRKAILDALRDALRKKDYVPIIFDFDQPHNRDVTETVTTLARMARFIIADITDAKSIPQELAFIVPDLPSVPVKPLLLSSQQEYGMFEHFTRFPWVLPVYYYTDQASLLQSLKENVIGPAEQKAQELAKR